jgi:hypothetical protein
VIVETVDPWQTDTLEGAVTLGIGLTVIAKLWGVPLHETALLVNTGVIVTLPVIAEVPALVAVKPLMLVTPLALPLNPIDVLLLLQL